MESVTQSVYSVTDAVYKYTTQNGSLYEYFSFKILFFMFGLMFIAVLLGLMKDR